MKIKIVKPIKLRVVGKTVLPKGHECEVANNVGEILVRKGFAQEVKKESKPKAEKPEVKKESKPKAEKPEVKKESKPKAEKPEVKKESK